MKAFQFSLEQILELRTEEEQEAEIRLGRAVGEWNRLNREKQEKQERRKRIAAGKTAEDILQASLYAARLEQEIRRFQKDMDERVPLLEQLREEYRKTRAAREGLEKLKERRKQEHEKKTRHRENLFLDDLGMNMARMRKTFE
jgi:flagellar protein FliJ